jgi:hypothetical protein
MEVFRERNLNPSRRCSLVSPRRIAEQRQTQTQTCVEAGSNTSIVTLRIVEGDEKGSLKYETVKYGHENKGTRTQERLRWRVPTAYTKETRPVVREGAPQKQNRNCERIINI